jgi:hypothetical protein
MIIGIFVWSWRVAARYDATSGRRGLGSQLMEMKTQSMADLRDGLATADFRQMENGIARLRQVNDAASGYLSELRYGEAGATFRQALERFSSDVQSRDLSRAKRSFDELTGSCVACHRGPASVPLDEDLKSVPK